MAAHGLKKGDRVYYVEDTAAIGRTGTVARSLHRGVDCLVEWDGGGADTVPAVNLRDEDLGYEWVPCDECGMSHRAKRAVPLDPPTEAEREFAARVDREMAKWPRPQ